MRRLALLLVALGLLAGAVALGLQVRAHEALERAGQDALAAGEAAAAAVLSYDHRTVDQDVAAAQELATGRFLAEYRATTTDLAEQARSGQAVVTATVHAASVVSAATDRVVVLLFADQTTARKDLPEPRVDQSRLRLVLVPVDGEWRVAELDAL